MLALLLLGILGCHRDKDGAAPPETGPEGGDDSAPDDSGPAIEGLSLDLSVDDDQDGSFLAVLSPADGSAPTALSLHLGLNTVDLPAGRYGLRAWRDDDGDGAWDGIWAETPEPAAILGLSVPRGSLELPLRASLPAPILDDDPAWVTLYEAAWDMAKSHVGRGTAENGLADAWMDEAFSDQIFQWDTCFMALFGLQGLDSFPVMGSLDNFYGTQADDGYICRVVDESDGSPGGDASDPSEPMINPPLFATAELAYARRTGDLSRLPRVIPVLDAYADWIDANVRTDLGLYYTSMLGSGMDNAPRDAAWQGWVDITAQQALARRDLGALAALAGDDALSAEQQAAADSVCADVEARLWDDATGWYFDLDYDSQPLTEKNMAGIWPLVAGCASPDRAARVASWLSDPAAFWRVQPFASTAADAASFDPDGDYWRGGVWAPTSYMTEQALVSYGRRDLARAATARQLAVMEQVYSAFTPQAGQLAADATGDGTRTIWELYAPDEVAPGTRWDDTYLGRQDFVGWSGLIPIAGLIEQIIGLEPDATTDTLTWHLSRADRHGIEGYRFGDQLVDLVADARESTDEAVSLHVSSSDAFTLVVDLAGQRTTLEVPDGASDWTVTPAAGPLATSLVPHGPYPGYAILGNGRISAVYTTADGTDDPPGVLHLYAGDHGTDLLEIGQTLVGQDGARITGWRTGLDPFFAAYAELALPDGGALAWRAFAAADAPALVIDGALLAGEVASTAELAPLVQLRESPGIDGDLSWTALERDDEVLVATLSDGRALALALSPTPEHWELGTVVADPVDDGLRDLEGEGRQMALEASLGAAAGAQAPFRQVIALGDSADEAVRLAASLLEAEDPLADAAATWADLAPGALCAGPDCPVASANLAAAAASDLGGAVPADLTGQFVTDERPQLYPRDAAMVARALLAAGREDAAQQILATWLDPGVLGPSEGAWYARYDALGRPVDGGSGAAYDTPEWDFNAYLALLAWELGPDTWSSAQRARILSALDFLVDQQDADGLWTEGGIVEWEGRLASTTMAAWAGLDAGARLADAWGDPARAADYRAAAGRARGGLQLLVDEVDPVLGDQRDGATSWDTSLLFGPLLGYPADPLLDLSWAWILDNARDYGGGVRYFEDPSGGTGSYGTDLFFFTTSATSGYGQSLGDDEGGRLLDWMLAMSNAYGLAPERVYSDGSGASTASPLSWCAAELALTLLTKQGLATGPTVDGRIAAAEYRQDGYAVVDHDGHPDQDGSLVALYAAAEEGRLNVGLRLAGPATGPYAIWLSGEDGLGAWTESDDGLELSFRADPDATPGAVAVLEVDPEAGTCAATTVAGASADCAELASGDDGLELAIELGDLGLTSPVQLIAQGPDDGGEPLLPASGSLSSAGPTDEVLVRFEVRADPGAGRQVTLSGDRDALGAWAGDAIGLDELEPGLWSTTISTEQGGFLAYKYLVGSPGDGSWAGVEFDGEDRSLRVEDLDGSGRVVVRDVFGVRGGELLDP